MTHSIHPSSIVEDGAQLGDNVTIGPFCHIGAEVVLHDNVKIHTHVVVGGNTTVGEDTEIFPFASIGLQPQDLKFHGEENSLIIGKNNTIREHVTINPGTEGGGGITKIGDNCLLMIATHIAHDCQVGNHVILANNATIAGHVIIGDHAIIGGMSAVHQYVRIGHQAMIGGMSGIENDIVPYGSATGERANLAGLNLVGLKRRNFSRENIHALRGAYRMLFASEGTLEERIEDVIEHFSDNETVMEIVGFLKQDSSRSICQPKNVKVS
jgi:UDP-N-acetylglucosamine acyltransferase